MAEDIHNHAIQLYAHSLAESDLAEVVAFYKTSTERDHNALIRSPDTYKDGNASQVVDEWIESLTPEQSVIWKAFNVAQIATLMEREDIVQFEIPAARKTAITKLREATR